MGSGFCLCVGADFLSARGVGGGGRFTDRRCRGRRPRRPAERSRPLPTMRKINGRQRQGCGPGMPGPYRVALFVRRGGFHIRPQACTAAEGLRTAAVGGGVPDAPRRGQDPSLQSKPLRGIQPLGCGPGMPGPYGGIHDSHALASACATFSTSPSFRAEYPATTVSARQSSGRAR